MHLFVDANVIIKAFTDNPEKGKCGKVLLHPFITNTLCLAEAAVSLSNILGKKDASQCIKSVLRSDAKIIAIDEIIFFEALKRIDKYPLSMFDLIHYTTAMLHQCSVFVSYDKDFDRLELPRREP